MPQRTALSGLSYKEIAALFAASCPPLPELRARQVFQRITANFDNFDALTELPLSARKELSTHFTLRTTRIDGVFPAEDGTIKLRILTNDGCAIESVIMEDGSGRRTACISSQVGCPMGCIFCATGKLGFFRNLNTAEIIEQIYHIRNIEEDSSQDKKRKQSGGQFENIVFMGMGEPLLNLEAVSKACAILCGEKSERRFSPRRITVSTCGIAGKIYEFARILPDTRLAVSVTSAREELRRRLMPGADSLKEIKTALLDYQKGDAGRRVTLEMTLFCGLNTSQKEARAVASFAKGLSVMVNLIPWNPVIQKKDGGTIEFDGSRLLTPSFNEVQTFREQLRYLGINAVLRRSKGRGVLGACGQLGSTDKLESIE
ncbi:MAG: 23S rRNA (adenine(2503)-C(2))-methyltransferase RlmN [Spirochaetaceae bacterium]|jgi:23S rRNA (adenine2503-C2)-methyltransferase|nr:23S rRNA (adenine(2503)-C(2))-methyltransferase RlmN [Spirochaetaceae bacterium]